MNRPAARATVHRVRFGEIVRLCAERCADPMAEGVERYVGLEHIDPGDLRVRRWGLVADGTTFTNRFRQGQVLFGKRRAYQRKVAVADFEGVCSGDIYVFEPSSEQLRREFLPFICQTEAFLRHAVGTSAGSLSPRTNWRSLAEFEVRLPPLSMQDSWLRVLRPAAECMDAHAELAGRAADLFEASANSLMVPTSAKLGNAGVLVEAPPHWHALTIRELCAADSDLVIGPFGSNLVRTDYAGRTEGVPVIFVRDIRPNEFSYISACFISQEKATELGAHVALPGDVVVTKMGVPESLGIPPGLTAVIPSGFPRSVVTADVVRVRLNHQIVVPSYFAYLLNCAWGRRQVWRLSPGSTTRFKMTLGNFSKIRVPVPPLSLQREIVERLDEIRQAKLLVRERQARAKEVISVVLAPLEDRT